MNKIKTLLTVLIIGIAGVVGMSAQESTDVSDSVSVNAGFESSYVFRGQEVDTDVVTASVVVELNKVYVGVDSFWATRTGNFTSEVNLYAGLVVDDVLFEDTFVDVGVVGYFYPNSEPTSKEYTTELYVGGGVDLSWVDVDGYVYYDIDRQALTFVGSIYHALVLLEDAPLFGEVLLVNKGQMGFVQSNDSLGDNTNLDLEYGFVNVSSNLVVQVNNVDVSAGVRYNFVDDNDVLDLNDFSWGVSAGYSF